MSRKHRSDRDRGRLFVELGGCCYLCGGTILRERGERWEIEHKRALSLLGEDENHNLALVHVKCHKAKTATDRAILAKAVNQQDRYLGNHRPKYKYLWPKGRRFGQ